MRHRPFLTLTAAAGLLVLAFMILPAHPAQAQRLTLADAVALAQEQSPLVRAAAEGVAEARARTRQAGAAFFPRLSLHSSYSQSDNPVNVFMYALNQGQFSLGGDLNNPEAADNWLLSGQAGWRLFSGGRDWANRRAAQAAERGMRHIDQATRNDVTLQVTRAYLGVLTAAEFVRAAEGSVRAYDSSAAVVKSRVDAGTALKTEWLNIQVQQAQAEEQLIQARNALSLAREGLRLAIGLDSLPYNQFGGLDELDIPVPEGVTPGERPEAASRQAFAEAARSELRAAKAGYLPSINAFASIDRYQGWEFDGDKDSWTAGLALEWSIFDGFLTGASVSEKRARLKAAEEMARQTRLQLSVERASSEFNLAEATQRVAVMERAVALATESANLTRRRLAQGLAISSQVIDAEEALVKAEVGLAQAKADRLLAIAALRRAYNLPIIGGNQS
ncbi:MAG TPA: TolC family protein [bacterium]|nr:TolC family protein [bacterium]